MLSDKELKALERYVTSDRNLDQALNLLPTHSEQANYLRFSHVLNEKGVAAFQADKKLKQEFD